MRKLLVALALVGVLAVPAAAAAKQGPPGVICGTSCDGGGGFTGCAQTRADDAAGLPYLSHVDHFLVVNFCKRNGVITSVSIAAHGCDVSGLAFCHLGPAWMTGGGVGSRSASFEAHATWGVTALPFYNNNDTLTLSI